MKGQQNPLMKIKKKPAESVLYFHIMLVTITWTFKASKRNYNTLKTNGITNNIIKWQKEIYFYNYYTIH